MWILGVIRSCLQYRAYRPTGDSIMWSLGVILVYSIGPIGLLVIQSCGVWVSFDLVYSIGPIGLLVIQSCGVWVSFLSIV